MDGYAELGGSRSGFTTVGTSSVVVLPPNTLRKLAVLVNDSSAPIYISRGQDAVIGSGTRLNAGGGVMVIEPDTYGRIWKGSINAIGGSASLNLCWCEDW